MGNTIPKSVKCIHSATKLFVCLTWGGELRGFRGSEGFRDFRGSGFGGGGGWEFRGLGFKGLGALGD